MVKFKNMYRWIGSAALFTVSFLLLIAAREVDGFATWYSKHIYQVYVEVIGRISGSFSFSISEGVLYIFLIYVLMLVGKSLYKAIWNKDKSVVGKLFSKLALITASLFLVYTLNCGINYERRSFFESSGMKVEEYSAQELKDTCLWLTERVNTNSSIVKRDEGGVMILERSAVEIAIEAMQNLGSTHVELSGYYPLPKGLWNSWILSIQNISGIYSPFTIEANYNRDMTTYNIPFTACHELSHLRGFMQEEEANYIAWLACSMSGSSEFQYSGDLLSWIYAMNVLAKVDNSAYIQVRQLLSAEAEADLNANREFWQRYDTKVAEVSSRVNDTYLKANGQADGVKSYDQMVDLLVAYYMQVNQ